MDSEAFVELALKSLACSQKELAKRLSVSPTQISKWKNGEHMSFEMEKRLRAIAKIGEMHPSFVLWSGSLAHATKWDKLIHFLAGAALENEETGYDTYPLKDEIGTLSWSTFHTLREMGITIPKKFPEELDREYEPESEDDVEEIWDLLNANPLSSTIYSIYKSLNDVYGFYAAYIDELINDDDLDFMGTGAENIEPCLISLAASKLEMDPGIAPNFGSFRYKVTKDFEEWLNIVKDKAFRASIPIRAELLRMVHSDHQSLGVEAEAESLGLNSARLHPDVYMNELLIGMRTIHQVLPAIMKKLGIDEEFKLDTSEFYAR